LKEKNVKKVLVQLPEGLINKFEEIAKALENEGLIPLISLETTYGACDLRDEEAFRLGCQAVLHIGHSEFSFEYLEKKVPVYFVEWFYDLDIKEIFPKVLEKIKEYEKIGIVYSIQYKNVAEILAKEIEKQKKVFVGGQILGCNISNFKKIENLCDAILIVSAGKFYAIYPSFSQKPVFLVDVERKDVFSLREEATKILKIKEWNKNVFLKAKKVGLLVSWKKGQMKNFEVAYKKIKEMGKEVFIFCFDELEEKMLEGLKIDVLVNLACPRIGFEDLARFKIPLINFEDIQTL